ncbi:MAG: hypothetical protein ABMA26_17710 [Limisphaerales bacterium]
MTSPRALTELTIRRIGVATLAVLLLAAPVSLRAAEALNLTPEQSQALEATRKGFGKGKKLQVEIEKMLGQATETNRVQLALKIAAVVSEKWPDEAADAIGKLVQLLPAQVVPLVHTALKAAPKQARPIASAAMTASPTSTVIIASAAIQLVPAEGHAILEAASWRVPKELKPQLDQLKASLPARVVKPPAKPVRVENPFSK